MVKNERTTRINEACNKPLTGIYAITHPYVYAYIVAFLLSDVHRERSAGTASPGNHAFRRLLSSLASSSISNAATEPAAGNPAIGVSTNATR